MTAFNRQGLVVLSLRHGKARCLFLLEKGDF